MNLTLYNTLSKKKEKFSPLDKNKVGLYSCGLTVYDAPHIGNMRAYVFVDTLRRVLEFNGYKVKHVSNITDVGHLTSDEDEGDDKIEKASREKGKTAKEISDFNTEILMKNLAELNILTPHFMPKATENVKEQIELVKKLEEKGFSYRTSDGIYFDTSKFSKYGKFGGIDRKNLKAGARVKLKEKRNPTDFALWKFSAPDGADPELIEGLTRRQMEWDSPWGVGFPGWHIECSAMAMKYLGETIDIHTGGVEHIPVHHANEIAQSEAVTKKQFVLFWLHNEHLLVEDKKMSKSLGTFLTLDDVIEKGFTPSALRYLFLTSHYRNRLNFNWQALRAAQSALDSAKFRLNELPNGGRVDDKMIKKFNKIINDDLNTPRALAFFWKVLKSSMPPAKKKATLLEFDRIFGLKLDENGRDLESKEIPEEITKMTKEREELRKIGEWRRADEIRKKIASLGFYLEDTPEKTKIKKVNRQVSDR